MCFAPLGKFDANPLYEILDILKLDHIYSLEVYLILKIRLLAKQLFRNSATFACSMHHDNFCESQKKLN